MTQVEEPPRDSEVHAAHCGREALQGAWQAACKQESKQHALTHRGGLLQEE